MNETRNDMTSLDVLLVEDEGMVAMLLEDMLADLGHKVVATAGQIDLATKLASEAPVSFAILDVNLNGDQTFPLADILAARGIPFIFATGYGVAGLNEKWRAVPAIQKPFQAKELAQAIALALEAARTGQQGAARPS